MNLESMRGIFSRRHASLMVALCCFGLAFWMMTTIKPLEERSFPVRFVRIQGQFQFIDKADLMAAVLPGIGRGYWGLDLDSIRARVEAIPWVSDAHIQKFWPDTLVLRLGEHVPYTRFGDSHLLSQQGIAYSPSDLGRFEGLPLIIGTMDQVSGLYQAFLMMEDGIRELGLKIEGLEVLGRATWQLRLSGGTTVNLGREAQVDVFERFISTLSLLGEESLRSMAQVDLRYPNGYAVEWKFGTQLQWAPFLKRGPLTGAHSIQRI
ncbi:MAG: FtsQ-type POTRA domain-containing protein [Methylococcales bacterium]|nr:FtsQ-type POTRA domain-containing protein [Methylococcales bacterium]